MNRPLLIIITSNRNYGWIARATLAANTTWADYVVVVDQMSTDGSREIYAQYDNVIVDDDADMSFKESTRAKMALELARQISGDKIIFALDIDEILPVNWQDTEDGKMILNSKPGDMFSLYWADIRPNGKTYREWSFQYKVFHDNGISWQGYEHEIHTPHLPYSDWDLEPTHIMNFPNIHFGHYNQKWREYQGKYYLALYIHQKLPVSLISANRSLYPSGNDYDKAPIKPIKPEWLYDNVDVFHLIDLGVEPQGVKLLKELIKQDGIDMYKGADIWDEDTLQRLNVKDPRGFGWRCLHYYLRKTQPISRTLLIRAIDKILKFFV